LVSKLFFFTFLILEAGERGKLLRILKLLHDKNETKSVYSQMKIISSRKKKKKKIVGWDFSQPCFVK